jgi:hypothetical protein
MKKYISVVMTAMAVLFMGLHPASAALLGMPLNLKAAIELRHVNAPAPAWEFHTDDVLIGQVLVRDC